ncbi:BTB/POZ domain-containing protein At5g48130 [Phalaenopsis equestris]|uniref:BTB/POZ domain-containing protein At5g48130 n=1 Tax=Phalaenopsis equestris TaxID=78828 RepID=UPI0009E6438D|nr:BTB/POZ domain-containing protein At5g48130 [Phalaenopsis equestris]
MEQTGITESPLTPPPSSSPNPSVLLRRRILSWSKENNNQPASVHVHIDGNIFHLHESPLVSKSGFFRKALPESFEIELPDSFPGGSEAFEIAILFSYDSPLPLDPFNVLALRSAASFLEMTEEYFSGNLCEQADLYLNQVVLQSWDDTLIVLQKCQILPSWAEELLFVSRCIESLAFMACMEILDPEREREGPLLSLQVMVGRVWDCEKAKEIAGQDLWVKELTALPFEFFDRIIQSLRNQGMEEKYVSPLIVLYANKWVLSKKTHKYLEENADENNAIDVSEKVSSILQGLLELLPLGEKTSKVIPVGFYLAMLSRSVSLGLEGESTIRLEEEVASLLHFARVEDLLLPTNGDDPKAIVNSAELKVMERIFSLHLSFKQETFYSGSSVINTDSMVAALWDRYLSYIAVDPKLDTNRFIKLIETVPMVDRETHDNLYKAISVFLLEHQHISSEDKASLCKYLNCPKLSQPICVQAVQNELMPLRLIVQALSVQQLHTYQAFKDFSESFRYTQFGDFSGSLLSSRSQALLNQYMGKNSYQQTTGEEDDAGGTLLDSLTKSTDMIERPDLAKAEYESASFRIQLLEEELMALKKSLKQQNVLKKSSRQSGADGKKVLKRRSGPGQVKSCIGSIGWGSQTKHVNRLVKAFRKLRILGRGKSKIRQSLLRGEQEEIDAGRRKKEEVRAVLRLFLGRFGVARRSQEEFSCARQGCEEFRNQAATPEGVTAGVRGAAFGFFGRGESRESRKFAVLRRSAVQRIFHRRREESGSLDGSRPRRLHGVRHRQRRIREGDSRRRRLCRAVRDAEEFTHSRQADLVRGKKIRLDRPCRSQSLVRQFVGSSSEQSRPLSNRLANEAERRIGSSRKRRDHGTGRAVRDRKLRTVRASSPGDSRIAF